jgi:hypothetical protein
MEKYNLEARYNPFDKEAINIDDAVFESMWKLFQAIGKFWSNEEHPENMKSSLLVFMQNRILLNCEYNKQYINAKEVIDELIDKNKGDENLAYAFLFTNPGANIAPPTTKLAHTRQKVSNEFISLQLALGGFKVFGGAKNYLGYFGGANIEGNTPYRTYKK